MWYTSQLSQRGLQVPTYLSEKQNAGGCCDRQHLILLLEPKEPSLNVSPCISSQFL